MHAIWHVWLGQISAQGEFWKVTVRIQVQGDTGSEGGTGDEGERGNDGDEQATVKAGNLHELMSDLGR